MRRSFAAFSLFFLLPLLTGCGAIGEKAASLSVVYGATAVLSLLMLIGYGALTKKKDLWFLLLFVSVLVVNIGYFALAISRSLDEALLANRLAYLGSVFLPLSMWMIILNATNIRYRKWLPALLLGIGVLVFLIAASPGYLDIYYKEVYLEKINGVTVLKKVYGPLHSLYLFYLLGYFGAMVTAIVHATLKDKIESTAYAAILAIAVFVNIGVWMIEQLVSIDFEILSVSYIISECFLLGLHLFMAETEKKRAQLLQQAALAVEPIPANETVSHAEAPLLEQSIGISAADSVDLEQLELFKTGLLQFTPTERVIYECYVAGKTTKEIMVQLNIKENTLKFHNKNIYSKVGVSSRKQLLALHRRAFPH